MSQISFDGPMGNLTVCMEVLPGVIVQWRLEFAASILYFIYDLDAMNVMGTAQREVHIHSVFFLVFLFFND